MLNSKLIRNLIVVAVIIALVIFFAWANRWNVERKKELSPKAIQAVKLLMTKAVQYSGQIAQDDNPLFALLHANYALAYVETARSIATDQQILRVSRYNAQALYERLLQSQQAAMQAIAEQVEKPPEVIAAPATTDFNIPPALAEQRQQQMMQSGGPGPVGGPQPQTAEW